MAEPRETTPDESPFSPAIALVTLARSVEVQLAGMLEPHALTVRKYAVLGHIAATPGLSLNDLGRRSRIPVEGVPALVRALAEAGWVRATTDSRGQPTQVTTTPAGDALLERLRREIAALEHATFATPSWLELADALAAVVRERDAAGPAPVD